MNVDIYRNPRNGTEFHIHINGSSCGECHSSEAAGKEIEMPESVYRALVDKFTSRGYIIVPEDMAISELASDWWSVVLLFLK